jgi:hypothetical protein
MARSDAEWVQDIITAIADIRADTLDISVLLCSQVESLHGHDIQFKRRLQTHGQTLR